LYCDTHGNYACRNVSAIKLLFCSVNPKPSDWDGKDKDNGKYNCSHYSELYSYEECIDYVMERMWVRVSDYPTQSDRRTVQVKIGLMQFKQKVCGILLLFSF